MDATELLENLKALSEVGPAELLQTARLAALGSLAADNVSDKELFGLVILLVRTIMEAKYSSARRTMFGCDVRPT